VSGSPAFKLSVGVVGGEALRVGDTERVEGGFTATESTVEALVDREVVDPVRSTEAARRGRTAAAVLFDDDELGVELLMLIRAASWFREGSLEPEVVGLSDLELGTVGIAEGSVDVIVGQVG
jgi:hypothetical protein